MRRIEALGWLLLGLRVLMIAGDLLYFGEILIKGRGFVWIERRSEVLLNQTSIGAVLTLAGTGAIWLGQRNA